MTCAPLQFCLGDKIENEMGGACSAYGGEETRLHF